MSPRPSIRRAGSAFGHRMRHPRYEETIGMDLALREIAPGHQVAADPCCLTENDWASLGGDSARAIHRSADSNPRVLP